MPGQAKGGDPAVAVQTAEEGTNCCRSPGGCCHG
ncbi:hypothetical protein CIB84_000650 [Bambusicola thoracicus]|uniref:Uncharacterized protein n=1 Tax=Bambusicola thoracicus TaxID=9083 RepID=A0A2P4TGX2_BAMTH|nr:hypothetical protein CIB84_000650 [Bambusicola thoracicus]